jgi:hypothetical protein
MEALGPDPAPQLVTVRSGGQVTLVDLGFDDPIGCLVGLLAPPGADAIGLATGGWALPPHVAEGEADVDRGRMTRPSSHPDALRARTLVVLDRTGAGACRLRLAGGPPRDVGLPDGLATDVLRRTLVLPTPPPGVPVEELLDGLWLCDIAEVSRRRGRRLTWHEAEHLRVRGVRSWADARFGCLDGAWPDLDLWPEAAVWMDDGIFARWCLSRLPPLPDLLHDARRWLRSSAYRQVRVAVTPPS